MPEVLQISRLNCEAIVPSSKHPNFNQWSMRAAECGGDEPQRNYRWFLGTVCDFLNDYFCMLGVGRHERTMEASNSAVDRPDSQYLRLIHCLTTVGRFCNVFLEKRELRLWSLHIRGSHRALVPPDAQHAKGIATKVSNRNPKCELCPLRFSETIRRPSHLRSLATTCE